MRYMQIKSSQRLHLVYEAGEGRTKESLIPAGEISAPICGRGFDENGNYRMTINVPLANACKRCLRIYASRQGSTQPGMANNPLDPIRIFYETI